MRTLLPGYKVRSWRFFSFSLALVLLLVACSPPAALQPATATPAEPRPLSQQLYIWQRQWTAQHPTALVQSRADFSQLRLLALQYHVSSQGPVWFETKLPLALLQQDGRPLWLVIRLDGQLPQLPEQALYQRLRQLLQQWQQAGLTPAVIEIDYDSARSQLPAYQHWLQQLRLQLPAGTQLAITALPDWLQSADFKALLQQVAVVTLQLHSVLSPEQGLFDPALAQKWASQLATLSDKPFYLALPAYHSALVRKAASSADWLVESEVPQLYAGERQELWLDPLQLQHFQLWLQQQRWPLLQGLVWFRLPLPQDQRSLPLSTLQAIVRQQPLQQRLQLKVTGTAPVLELWAHNSGQTPQQLPAVLQLHSSQCLQAEAITGSRLQAEPGGYQLQLPNRKLAAGQRQLLAWFHCQQLQLIDTAATNSPGALP
jgi:hypothetical protein